MAIAKPKGRIHELVRDLQEMILKAFPEARFRVTPMPEGEGTAIWTYSNADFWDIADFASEREFEIMMDEGVFLYVIPMPMEALED